MLELRHNQKHCLCSKCDNIFIATSNCGNDLNQLPTMCMQCYDKTSYTYNVKTCSWCYASYIKIDGCNVVKCKCGGYTCDLCGERISNHDSIHFAGSVTDNMIFFGNKCAGRGISEFTKNKWSFFPIIEVVIFLIICFFSCVTYHILI